MFELLAVLLSGLLSRVDLKSALHPFQTKRRRQVARDLFSIYTRLNSVIIDGTYILACLSKAQHKGVGGGERLRYVLRRQGEDLEALLGSVLRAAHSLQIMSSWACNKLMSELVHKFGRVAFVEHLFEDGHYPAGLDETDYADVLFRRIIEIQNGKCEDGKLPDTSAPDPVFRRPKLADCCVPLAGNLSREQQEAIRAHIRRTKPQAALDELQKIAERLREAIVTTFGADEFLNMPGTRP